MKRFNFLYFIFVISVLQVLTSGEVFGDVMSSLKRKLSSGGLSGGHCTTTGNTPFTKGEALCLPTDEKNVCDDPERLKFCLESCSYKSNIGEKCLLKKGYALIEVENNMKLPVKFDVFEPNITDPQLASNSTSFKYLVEKDRAYPVYDKKKKGSQLIAVSSKDVKGASTFVVGGRRASAFEKADLVRCQKLTFGKKYILRFYDAFESTKTGGLELECKVQDDTANFLASTVANER